MFLFLCVELGRGKSIIVDFSHFHQQKLLLIVVNIAKNFIFGVTKEARKLFHYEMKANCKEICMNYPNPYCNGHGSAVQ